MKIAAKIFYNNQNDLVEHHGYDEYDEVFEKGIQTIVENPFANPFYDMSAFSIKKERPKGFVAPPAFTPPIDLIKQEQPNAIEGFETNGRGMICHCCLHRFSRIQMPPLLIT